MPQIISSNISSLNAQSNLDKSQWALSRSLQRLSSGLRINSAKDDAAGLAISARMSAQISGLNQARRNANDGVSLSQTAESALSSIGQNLNRIRDLAVQSANATNSDIDRAALNQEVVQLQAEIERVGKQTNFNGRALIDGSFVNQYFQIGANANEGIVVSINDVKIGSMSTHFTSEQVQMSASSGDHLFQINGEDIHVTITNQSDLSSLKAAINAAYGKTNVKAEFAAGTDGVEIMSALVLSGPSFTVSNGLLRNTHITGILAGVFQIASQLSVAGQQTVSAVIGGPSPTQQNAVAGQTLTINAEKGDTLINVQKGDSAKAIADKINSAAEITGVKASAQTLMTLTGLGANGTVSFSLSGKNVDTGIKISADVTQSDLSNLVTAINKASDSTGISATLSTDKRSVKLVNAEGHDIKIANWNSTALLNKTVNVLGATGTPTLLLQGNTAVSAGKLSFSADVGFSIKSSLGAGAGNVLNSQTVYSSSTTVTGLDVTTVASATRTIQIADNALNMVNSSRAKLGAIQNRFDAIITNLQSSAENLSAARSRIRDADFAEESSNMAIATILQQSGISILAHANQWPNNVLSLLRKN